MKFFICFLTIVILLIINYNIAYIKPIPVSFNLFLLILMIYLASKCRN